MLFLQHGRALTGLVRGTLQFASIPCALFVGWMWATTPDASVFLYRGGFLLLAIAVAVVMAGAVQPKPGFLGRVLSLPPLRGLGLISYGIYLWHWPIYLVLTPDRTGWDGYGLFAVRVAVTLAISIASYHLIETPFRRGAFRRRRVSWAIAPAAATAVAVALVLMTRGGEPTLALSAPSSVPEPPSASLSLSNNGGAVTSPPARVLVVGDSVALTMGQGLVRAESSWNLSVWNTGRLGCGVLRGNAVLVQSKWVAQRQSCNDWPNRWQSYVDVFRPDVVVMLVGAWDTYDREVEGRRLEFGTPDADAYALGELKYAVDVLSSRGAEVMLLTTPYFEQRDLAVSVEQARFDARRIDRLNELFAELAEERADRVTLLELCNLVTPSGDDETAINGIEMRGDGAHFTPEGADFVASWLAPRIVAAARDTSIVLAEAEAPGKTGSDELPPSRWLELLAQVPDTSETRSWTVMNDYARFREAFGVSLPEPGAGEDALFEYFQRLLFDEEGRLAALVAADVTGIRKFPPPLADTRTELGFTIADIDQDVSAGETGAAWPIQVLRGRFDRETVDRAVRADPYFRDLLEETSHSGVNYYSWGGDFEANSERVSPVRSLGQGHRLALRSYYLYWSVATEGLEAMIDAGLGRQRSLADLDDFRLLANALDRLNTYTALFSDDTDPYSVPEMARRAAGTSATEGRVLAIQTKLEGEPRLLPYQAFATGTGVDADGMYVAVVLLHADEETARRNVQRLRDRIEEGTSWIGGQPYVDFIDSADISHEGHLVLAELRTDQPGLWFGLPIVRETLLLHE
jgi:hypothetical protein